MSELQHRQKKFWERLQEAGYSSKQTPAGKNTYDRSLPEIPWHIFLRCVIDAKRDVLRVEVNAHEAGKHPAEIVLKGSGVFDKCGEIDWGAEHGTGNTLLSVSRPFDLFSDDVWEPVIQWAVEKAQEFSENVPKALKGKTIPGCKEKFREWELKTE